jgi:hypothetical protein
MQKCCNIDLLSSIGDIPGTGTRRYEEGIGMNWLKVFLIYWRRWGELI